MPSKTPVTYIRLIQAGQPDEYHLLDSFIAKLRLQVESEEGLDQLLAGTNLSGSGKSALFSYRIEQLTDEEIDELGKQS